MQELRKGGLLVAQIHQLAGRIFARKLKQANIHEINPAQGRILFALWEQDGISVSELSSKTLLEKSTLTAMLDRLEEAGFIMRIPAEGDRRKTIVLRTEKDKAFQETYIKVSAEMLELFYHGFSTEEVDVFEESLARILANLRAGDNEK